MSEEADERGDAGIFYTPRTEIDLMCRLALVDHLANHLGEDRKSLLYELVFALEPDEKAAADSAVARAGFWPAVNSRLREITVLDLACGSGLPTVLPDLREHLAGAACQIRIRSAARLNLADTVCQIEAATARVDSGSPDNETALNTCIVEIRLPDSCC